MKQFMSRLGILGIAIFFVLPASWSGEFNFASYALTTLQEIIIAEEQNYSLD